MSHQLDLNHKIEALPSSTNRSPIIRASATFLNKRDLRLYRIKTHKFSWLIESPEGRQWMYANVDHLVRSLVDFYDLVAEEVA